MKITIEKSQQIMKEIDLGQEIDLSASDVSVSIGRSQKCHIVLDDKKLSREHAELHYSDGKWSIVSLSDFNKIFVNGKKVEEADLSSGDEVEIGPFTLRVTLEEAAPVVESKSVEEVPQQEVTPEEAAPEEIASEEPAQAVAEDAEFEEEAPEAQGTQDVDGEGMEAEAFAEEGIDGEEAGDFSQEENMFDENSEEEHPAEDFDMEVAGENEDGDATKFISTFVKFGLDIFGEYAPYDTYIIESKKIVIGRDSEQCTIVLADPEVSSVHATISRSNAGLILEDMQSGNGTIVNGERVNKAEITSGDEFIIGSTTFTVKLESEFIEKQQHSLMPVEENQVVEVEEVVEVDESFSDEDAVPSAGEKEQPVSLVGKLATLFTKDALKDPDKRKKILYLVIGVLALFVLMEPEEKPKKKIKKVAKKEEKKAPKKQAPKLSPEELQFVDSTYNIAITLFGSGKYKETIHELDKVMRKHPDYKRSRALYQAAKEGLRELELISKREREAKEKARQEKKIKELVVKARKAIKEKKTQYAQQILTQITKLNPEHEDLLVLKLDFEAHKNEEERKALELAAKKAERARQESRIKPGKALFRRQRWHAAIAALEGVLEKEKSLDKDLAENVTEMLKTSREQLSSIVDPLIEKAQSLKEGQDLKGAYESYLEILKHDPSHTESLNETSTIRDKLMVRSRKVYREAIVSESLSLFNDAKEKFQEVQQISPVDSKYYIQATKKLKHYTE